MDAGQYADFRRQRADFVLLPSVHAVPRQQPFFHNLLLQLIGECLQELFHIRMGFLILGKPLLRHGVPAALPDVLVVGVHGGSGLVPVAPGNLVKQLLIKRGVGIVKLFLPDFGYHAVDEGNLFLIFLMGHLNGAEHGVVVHLVGPGLDHDHLFAGRDDHHIQIGEFLLFLTGIQHQFPVHKAHFQGPDRTVPGNVGDGEGGGGANQRGDFRGAVGVHAHDRTHDRHIVAEIIGEEGADRAVNDAGS